MKVRVCGLLNRADAVLTLKYRYADGPVNAIPGGGVEAGERLAQTLQREFREELGLDIEVGALRYVGDAPQTGHIPQTLHVVFDVSSEGTPILNRDHTSAQSLEWLTRDSLGGRALYPAISNALFDDWDTDKARYLHDCLRRALK